VSKSSKSKWPDNNPGMIGRPITRPSRLRTDWCTFGGIGRHSQNEWKLRAPEVVD